jgi:hypothetical protein
MNDIPDIPLPERPGTMWEFVPGSSASRCKHCQQSYNSHGAPSDVAKALGIPEDRRHLICPASNEAWAFYWNRRSRATVELFCEDLKKEFQRFTEAERAEIATFIFGMQPPMCPMCGGPLNHPIASSMCKRVKAQKEEEK